MDYKFVKFECSAGSCGTEHYEFGKFEEDATDDEISEICDEIGYGWCESYGVDPEEESEKSGVEFELDASWSVVDESEVEQDCLTDYTK